MKGGTPLKVDVLWGGTTAVVGVVSIVLAGMLIMCTSSYLSQRMESITFWLAIVVALLSCTVVAHGIDPINHQTAQVQPFFLPIPLPPHLPMPF